MELVNWIFNNKIDHIISILIIIMWIKSNFNTFIHKYNLRIIWFGIIFTVDLIYCICNWERVVIFSPFTGNSALLILLIILSLLPFVWKIKIGDNELSIAMTQVIEFEQKFQDAKAKQEEKEKESKSIPQNIQKNNQDSEQKYQNTKAIQEAEVKQEPELVSHKDGVNNE